MAQNHEDERGPTPEDAAAQARAGHVGRMSPIDPGIGPGGATAETDHTRNSQRPAHSDSIERDDDGTYRKAVRER